MNLLKAELYHLCKDKIFWTMLVIVAAIPVASCLMMDYVFALSGINAESIILQSISADFFCAILGVAISLFIGRDYTNHTIRNKLCYGEKRQKIMAVSFSMSLLITAIFLSVSFIFALLSAWIFAQISISVTFWGKYLCQIAILAAFAVLVTAVVICTKNEKAGLLFTVIGAVLLSAFSYLLPMLAATSEFARIACRCLYMIVSTMLLNSVNGVYAATGGAIFTNMYLNALIMSAIYLIMSVAVTAIVVKKQSYK
ncbi:MAG: ABC transporter permease [Erysipelotrichaceae bacterium]